MVLSFWKNQINLSTPENFGNLKNLTGLNLSENFISGRILSQFQYLARLQNLNLSSNNLSGTIPPDGFLNLHNTEMVPKPHNYSSLFFLYPLPCFLPVQSLGFSVIFERRKKEDPTWLPSPKMEICFPCGNLMVESLTKTSSKQQKILTPSMHVSSLPIHGKGKLVLSVE